MENEKAKVESILLRSSNLELIKGVFVNTKDYQLVSMLESILKILTASPQINKQLGETTKEGGFVGVLKNKLHHPNAHARVNLLKTLNALCSKYNNPQQFLKHNNLLKVVNFMATNDSSMLVKNMAVLLLREGGQN